MKLSEDIKELIKEEFNIFKEDMYKGKTKEERQALGQFYTPAEISIQMLEKYEVDSLAGLTILDPTSGSGNLLAAALIAGADSDKVFGNEYDPNMAKLCLERLNRVCDILDIPHVKDWQIHVGNALQKRCLTEFSEDYDNNYNILYIDDLEYAQSNDSWEMENKRAEERYNKANSKALLDKELNIIFDNLVEIGDLVKLEKNGKILEIESKGKKYKQPILEIYRKQNNDYIRIFHKEDNEWKED